MGQVGLQVFNQGFQLGLLLALGIDNRLGGAGDEVLVGEFGNLTLKLLFGILPDNPVKPFLEGNTLQIVFMALMVAAALLVAGNSADQFRRGIV